MFEALEETELLKIIFSADLDNVSKAAALTDRFLLTENLMKIKFQVNLVMRELLNNAVIHGSGRDHRKSVQYKLGLNGTYLIMQVEDEGDGFDWVMTQEKNPELQADHGRGVPILEKYCASYFYNEKGNGVTVKFLIK